MCQQSSLIYLLRLHTNVVIRDTIISMPQCYTGGGKRKGWGNNVGEVGHSVTGGVRNWIGDWLVECIKYSS